MPHYCLGTDQQDSSFAGRDLRVLADTVLNMCQQHALAAKKVDNKPGSSQAARGGVLLAG